MIIKVRKTKIDNNEVLKNNSKIRGFINKIWKFRSDLLKKKRNWSIVCSCLDVIHDTENAIKDYKKLKKVGYLELAWILQILYSQSDVIKNLYEVFDIGKCDLSEELKAVREIRNKSIWHPTKRDQWSYIVYSPWISKESYKLVSYLEDRTDFDDISLYNLIDIQYKEVTKLQNKIIEWIEKQIYTHKQQFINNNLLKMLKDSNYNYHLEKLFEPNRDLFDTHLSCIKENFNKIKDGIYKRYDNNLDDVWFTKDLIDKIDFILNILYKDNFDISQYIYLDWLRNYFNELEDILKEIDDEFQFD